MPGARERLQAFSPDGRYLRLGSSFARIEPGATDFDTVRLDVRSAQTWEIIDNSGGDSATSEPISTYMFTDDGRLAIFVADGNPRGAQCVAGTGPAQGEFRAPNGFGVAIYDLDTATAGVAFPIEYHKVTDVPYATDSGSQFNEFALLCDTVELAQTGAAATLVRSAN